MPYNSSGGLCHPCPCEQHPSYRLGYHRHQYCIPSLLVLLNPEVSKPSLHSQERPHVLHPSYALRKDDGHGFMGHGLSLGTEQVWDTGI